MNPTSKDPRQWYAQAQDSIKTLLELLTAPEIKCHIMVLSHIDLVEMPDGSSKGFASSVGKALGPLPAQKGEEPAVLFSAEGEVALESIAYYQLVAGPGR